MEEEEGIEVVLESGLRIKFFVICLATLFFSSIWGSEFIFFRKKHDNAFILSMVGNNFLLGLELHNIEL